MSNWPLLQFVQDLGDFDLVALLLGAVIAFFSAGFAIDTSLAVTEWVHTGTDSMRCLALMQGSAPAIGGSNLTPATILI